MELISVPNPSFRRFFGDFQNFEIFKIRTSDRSGSRRLNCAVWQFQTWFDLDWFIVAEGCEQSLEVHGALTRSMILFRISPSEYLVISNLWIDQKMWKSFLCHLQFQNQLKTIWFRLLICSQLLFGVNRLMFQYWPILLQTKKIIRAGRTRTYVLTRAQSVRAHWVN